MIKTALYDPQSSCRAQVTADGALLVAQVEKPLPPVGTPSRVQFLSGQLGSAGLNSGATNQNVNGATTPHVFYLSASEEYDIQVLQISVLIADTAIVNNRFGNETSLVNGWTLKIVESGVTTKLIDAAKTGGQIVVQSGGVKFGNGTTINIVPNWTGNDDAFVLDCPISAFIPGGLRIGRGTLDRIESVVADNLAGLTEFRVYVFGYKNIP